MTHQWTKLGQLYSPKNTNQHPKLISHAANPLPIHIKEDIYRIYFSGRDINNRSSVGAVDIDIIKQKIIQEYHQPFFKHGPEGSFFADGVSIGNCYEADSVTYMLFMGWQNPEDDHWRGEIGRLIVNPDLTLELDSKEPFMKLDKTDPISLSYPWVEKTSEGYNMWYGSTNTWNAGNDEMLHVINFASSKDGHHWNREGLTLPFEMGKAQAFSRPTVVRNANNQHEMWFSYRGEIGQKYRIGTAVSPDERHWELSLNTTGIDVSENGWDSEMIEYPFVFEHNSKRYMLYNGNDYGKTGFGLAVLT